MIKSPQNFRLNDKDLILQIGTLYRYLRDDLRIIDEQMSGNNARITPEGGLAVKLINKTGAASVKGSLVSSNPAVGSLAGSVVLQSNEFDTIGVFYDSGVPDGNNAWVVVSGLADVLWKNSTGSTKGNVAIADAVDGRASDIAVPSTSPAAAEHFKEIGHVLETKSGGTDILVRCVLHFN